MRFNSDFFEFLVIPAISQWWANIDITLHARPDDMTKFGKEKALLVMNHKCQLDWVVIWCLGHYYDVLQVKLRSDYVLLLGRLLNNLLKLRRFYDSTCPHRCLKRFYVCYRVYNGSFFLNCCLMDMIVFCVSLPLNYNYLWLYCFVLINIVFDNGAILEKQLSKIR